MALLVTLAAGCVTSPQLAAPTPIVKLRSTSENATWIGGRSVAVLEKNGMRVAAAFDHQDDDLIAFRIELENGAETAIDVDPRAMTFNSFEDHWSTEVSVIDPERVIASIDARRVQERADAQRDTAVLAPLLFLSALSDIATVATGKSRGTTGLLTASIAGDMHHRQARHENTVGKLAAEKQVWMNAAFRRTAVAPGQVAAGFVYVPLIAKAHYVRLTLRIGGVVFRFHFEQA